MFPVARAILLSMREREDFVGVLKIVCGWASKTWLLPYTCCGLHFIDSAACVLSFDHFTPLHTYRREWFEISPYQIVPTKDSTFESGHYLINAYEENTFESGPYQCTFTAGNRCIWKWPISVNAYEENTFESGPYECTFTAKNRCI